MNGGETGRVLRDRNAGLYLSGVVVSGFGTTAMWLVAGVWVKSLTGSDTLAALTVFALWAPVLAGPALGALADRLPRRRLLVGVGLLMAALLPVLLLLDSADRVWLLFAVLFAYGVCGALHDAAEAALVPQAVDVRLLGDFNGLRMTANEGMKLLAPPVGAALFARFGGASVALLDAVTFALAAGLFALLRVRAEPPERSAGTGTGTGARGFPRVREGARELWGSPVLRPLVAGGAAVMFLAGLNGAVIYAVADDVLGHAPTYVGVLYAVQGAGSVLTGLVAGPLLRRMPERVFAAAGTALFALGIAGRALPCDAVALVCSAVIGAGLPCVLIAALTAVQREVPNAVLARAAATANTLIFVPNALALALGAALVAFVDVRVLLPVLAVAGLAVALLLAAGARAGVAAGAGARAGRK
ncbi:MFS transporter [Streptomyces avidinii]|uniref:MFS family permease n=1 Tax=Streptomyces avidinii TaxID=1895 RepID=A0ABS4L8B0_STRAV|nr:MFS transporter [Streptomyces avidinii]MBP2038361.1 MFS family permease [Streptomyces avidinii]GGZ14798.1 MFS transporter [Streptomyces avidinii]